MSGRTMHAISMKRQAKYVHSFDDLVSTTLRGDFNAVGWKRDLQGDFAEIVRKLRPEGNITTIEPEDLQELSLSEKGAQARETIVNDMALLTAHGADPVLNLIHSYDRDDSNAFFPTDVYSFHMDRSPVPTHTLLCTYHGRPSERLANARAMQKVRIPEIRARLRASHEGDDESFETYLSEHFYDLHYQPVAGARALSLGVGHLWKLSVDHPGSGVLPCVHRAPREKSGQPRLLLIC